MNFLTSHNAIREPLTLEQIAKRAPSVFADHASPDVSERYRFIPTSVSVEALMNNGFECVEAQQTRARSVEGVNFARHLLRFRLPTTPAVGEVQPEILLRNAHDGTSAKRFDAGVFRFVCANGLVVAESMFASISLRHSGKKEADLIEAARHVMDGAVSAATHVQKWSRINLQVERIMSFAKQAAVLRWGDEAERVDLNQLVRSRRSEDNSSSLWHVFNRVQENLIGGGVRLAPSEDSLTARRTKSRALSAIDDNVRVNKGLWQLAEDYSVPTVGCHG